MNDVSKIVKNQITPEEIAVKMMTKNWSKIFNKYKMTEEEQEKIHRELVKAMKSSIQLERDTTDKFIEITESELGIVGYYLYLIDKVKLMLSEAFIENSKHKRDAMLVDMMKILGTNVVEETIPVPYKEKKVI
jgi:hypothetical protein